MQTLNCAVSIFKREYLLTFRNFYDVLTIITFFILLGIIIFVFSPLAQIQKNIQSKLVLVIIWTLITLKYQLYLSRKYYQDDLNDGSIILFFISGVSYGINIVDFKIMIIRMAFFSIPFSCNYHPISLLLLLEGRAP